MQSSIINKSNINLLVSIMKTCLHFSMYSDRRVGYCFLQTIGGRCTARTSELRTVTKADCCCTMGAAWGPHCEICPSRDSDNYNELCLDKGFSVDGQGSESYIIVLSFNRYFEFCCRSYHLISCDNNGILMI